MTTLILPIKAIPKGRPRVSKHGHAFTPARTRDFETLAKLHISRQFREEIIKTGVSINIIFGFKVPKSWKQSVIDNMNRLAHLIVGDVDNYAKATIDAMNGIVFEDDRQITRLTCEKKYSDTDFILIDIE